LFHGVFQNLKQVSIAKSDGLATHLLTADATGQFLLFLAFTPVREVAKISRGI
jgi:hypothetical protein